MHRGSIRLYQHVYACPSAGPHRRYDRPDGNGLEDVTVAVLLAEEGGKAIELPEPKAVVIDAGLISSRNPVDLEAICETILEEFGSQNSCFESLTGRLTRRPGAAP